MGKLSRATFYLSGAIDRSPDLGVAWRNFAQEELQRRYNANVYNPMDKPIDIADEHEGRAQRKQWKENHQFSAFSKFIRKLCRVDKEMCRRSTAGIFYMDMDIVMAGTMDELFQMIDEGKPVMIVCKQGITAIADWIFGRANFELFFDTWDDLFLYLDEVDRNEAFNMDEWLFF
jgi:hypothetical protein